MRKFKNIFALLVISYCVCANVRAQTNDLTYQGRLADGSAAASGNYDFIFKLFDDPEDPVAPQIGTDQVRDDVPVSGGAFSVVLNFGITAFDGGGQRYLEIYVRPGTSTAAHTKLLPRQRITSSPFSIKSLKADALSNSCVLCVTNSQIFSIDGSKVTGSVSNAATATTATNVSGVVPVANGGTGSATKNFVDLQNNQTVFGIKNFVNGATFGGATFNYDVTMKSSLGVNGSVTADQFHGNGDGLVNVPGTFKWQVASGVAYQAQPDNGYVATNDAQVTITLPLSIGIGQTVRVSGSGAGGWRISQNEGQSILVGGGIKVTLPLPVWTARATNRDWQSVASSADGTKLVAVARSSQIYTSTDSGLTWTPRDTSRLWRSVASSADGSKLVAVVENGQIYTSTDSGVTWTPRESNRFWTCVASSADGTKLAATGNAIVYLSTNSGVTWTPRPIAGSVNLGLIASSSDGTKLVAADNGYSTGKIYTSDNSGVGWQQRAHGGFWQSIASSGDGTKLFAGIDPGSIFVSHDSGVTWDSRGYLRNWYGIASSADGTRIVAADYGYGIYFSLDSGLTWTAVSQDPRSWLSVAMSADGSKLVAAAQNGQIYTATIPAYYGRSTTVGTAGYLIGGQFTSVELQYIGNGQFIALSAVGPFQGN